MAGAIFVDTLVALTQAMRRVSLALKQQIRSLSSDIEVDQPFFLRQFENVAGVNG